MSGFYPVMPRHRRCCNPGPCTRTTRPPWPVGLLSQYAPASGAGCGLELSEVGQAGVAAQVAGAEDSLDPHRLPVLEILLGPQVPVEHIDQDALLSRRSIARIPSVTQRVRASRCCIPPGPDPSACSATVQLFLRGSGVSNPSDECPPAAAAPACGNAARPEHHLIQQPHPLGRIYAAVGRHRNIIGSRRKPA